MWYINYDILASSNLLYTNDAVPLCRLLKVNNMDRAAAMLSLSLKQMCSVQQQLTLQPKVNVWCKDGVCLLKNQLPVDVINLDTDWCKSTPETRTSLCIGLSILNTLGIKRSIQYKGISLFLWFIPIWDCNSVLQGLLCRHNNCDDRFWNFPNLHVWMNKWCIAVIELHSNDKWTWLSQNIMAINKECIHVQPCFYNM